MEIIPLLSCQRQGNMEKLCGYRDICAILLLCMKVLGLGGEKRVEKSVKGSASMADRELGFGGELGHGFVVVGEEEERVVAEAVDAARGGEDFAFDGAFGDTEYVAIAGCCEDAAISSRWMRAGKGAQGLLEAEVIALVGAGGCGAGEALVVGVAGGADAGGSVESVDFEAGVVGDDDLAAEVMGVVDGLDTGVAFEGEFVFRGRGDFMETWQRLEDDVLRCGSGEVAELAGVGGGDVELHASDVELHASIDIPCREFLVGDTKTDEGHGAEGMVAVGGDQCLGCGVGGELGSGCCYQV
jgi:hypothetical protein